MNGIGLDVQRTTTQMILREGEGQAARLRSVGDGVRDIIPHLVAENAFGARAAEDAFASSRLGPDAATPGPWSDTPGAALFWRAMRSRLSAFLGRVEPTQRNAFAVCAAIQAREFDAARAALARVLESAGWEEAALVSAPYALAASIRGAGSPRQRVAALAVGDQITSLELFEIDNSDAAPRVRPVERAAHLDVGAASWETELWDVVRRRTSDAARTPAADIAFRAAALEFGVALGRDRGGRPVVWTGPRADRNFTELALTRDDCLAWPSIQRLTRFIEENLANAARLDCVIVGGVGAAWPFAAIACARFAPLWRSGAPWEDIARGAAFLAGAQALQRPPDLKAIDSPEAARAPKPAPENAETPPWLRRG